MQIDIIHFATCAVCACERWDASILIEIMEIILCMRKSNHIDDVAVMRDMSIGHD